MISAPETLNHEGSFARPFMLRCAVCGRKIDADEVKYRVTLEGKSVTICADDAKKQGI